MVHKRFFHGIDSFANLAPKLEKSPNVLRGTRNAGKKTKQFTNLNYDLDQQTLLNCGIITTEQYHKSCEQLRKLKNERSLQKRLTKMSMLRLSQAQESC